MQAALGIRLEARCRCGILVSIQRLGMSEGRRRELGSRKTKRLPCVDGRDLCFAHLISLRRWHVCISTF